MTRDPYDDGAYRPREPFQPAHQPQDPYDDAYRARQPGPYPSQPRYPDGYRHGEPQAYQPPDGGDRGYRPGPADPGAQRTGGTRQPPSPPRRGPQHFPYIVGGLIFLVIVAAIGGFIAGRNTAPRTSTPATAGATPSSPAAAASAAPATATAAKAAATTYFSLYAAGQYAATYPLIDAQARRKIPEATWVTVHQDCKSRPLMPLNDLGRSCSLIFPTSGGG